MCHFSKILERRAKAVKMCTGLSALVHWAASSYFTFSIKSRCPASHSMLSGRTFPPFSLSSHLTLFTFLPASHSIAPFFPFSIFCSFSLSVDRCQGCIKKERESKLMETGEKDLLQLVIAVPTLCDGRLQITLSEASGTATSCWASWGRWH